MADQGGRGFTVRFAIFVFLLLAGGCLNQPDYWTASQSLKGREVLAGSTVSYGAFFGPLNVTLGAPEKMIGEALEEVEVVPVFLDAGEALPRQTLFLDPFSAEPWAIQTDGHPAVLEVLDDPSRIIETTLLTLPLQSATPAFEGELRVWERRLSPDSAPKADLVLNFDVTRYDWSAHTATTDQVSHSASLVDGLPFASFVSSLDFGRPRLAAYTPGQGPAISWSDGPLPERSFGGSALPWTGPVPPETAQNPLDFPLAAAYDVLMAESADAASWAAAHQEHHVCFAQYTAIRPLLPPESFTWYLHLCENGQGFAAFVRHNGPPVEMDEVTVQPSQDSAAYYNRTFYRGPIVPLNELFFEVTQKLGWTFDTPSTSFTFDARSGSNGMLRYEEDPHPMSRLVTFGFGALDEPQYRFLGDTGRLDRVVMPE